MFLTLLRFFLRLHTQADRDLAEDMIERALEKDQLTAEEYDLLTALLAKLDLQK